MQEYLSFGSLIHNASFLHGLVVQGSIFNSHLIPVKPGKHEQVRIPFSSTHFPFLQFPLQSFSFFFNVFK